MSCRSPSNGEVVDILWNAGFQENWINAADGEVQGALDFAWVHHLLEVASLPLHSMWFHLLFVDSHAHPPGIFSNELPLLLWF